MSEESIFEESIICCHVKKGSILPLLLAVPPSIILVIRQQPLE